MTARVAFSYNILQYYIKNVTIVKYVKKTLTRKLKLAIDSYSYANEDKTPSSLIHVSKTTVDV